MPANCWTCRYNDAFNMCTSLHLEAGDDIAEGIRQWLDAVLTQDGTLMPDRNDDGCPGYVACKVEE